MVTFSSDRVEIAYLDTLETDAAARGRPLVVLIHGFASNAATNWVQTGWVRTLSDAGYRVVAYDNRGHGASEKLYDVKEYGSPMMAEDARRLLDHLGVVKAHVMGYSMGARITAFLLLNHPERVLSAVFGGMGINMVHGMKGRGDGIAEALEAPSLDDVTDPGARMFRAFAEQTKSDLKALAACMRSARDPITAERLAGVTRPVLVGVGTDDAIAGSAAELAALMPHGQFVDLVGRDHNKAVGDKAFKSAVVRFLAEQENPMSSMP
jgi:pimeloyl-ACP methyl ester carboxylesterase